MSNSIYRPLVRSRISYPIHCVRFSPFYSVASKSISGTANKDHFTANYLINTFGFSQEKAFAVSKYSKIGSTEIPESVTAFLKSRGLTADQIGSIVRNYPPIILRFDPRKVLMPKIEFFLSSGISQAEVNNIILRAPIIFSRSLENHITPSFNYIKSFFNSNGSSLSFTKHNAMILSCGLESKLIPNIEILKDSGVPVSRIILLMKNHPRTFIVETEKFREVVKEVMEMNFSPRGALFTDAVRVIRSMNKLTWEKKVAVYKKWGMSENDVILAFQRHPSCMTVSTDKITTVMDFLAVEMGLDSSFMVKRPKIVSYSFEKRIKPRYSVYKDLLKNGLINKVPCLSTMFSITETDFLKKFVLQYEKEVPGLLQLYQNELAVSKT